MIDFNTVALEVFQVIRAYGDDVVLYDADGNRVFEPNEARRFYASSENTLVSISEAGDDSAVSIFISESANIADMKDFIDTIRAICVRSNLLFHVRKSSREIKPHSFATRASLGEQENMNMNIMEGLYGTSRSSYLRLENAKMIVRHSEKVRENMIGGRGRNIQSIFVENGVGERFLFPVRNLYGARAMTQHVNQGGTFADEVGQQIIRMAQDFKNLASVAASLKSNNTDSEASNIRESVVVGLGKQKYLFGRLFNESSYASACQKLKEASALHESDDFVTKVDAVKAILGEGFTDEQITSVAKIYTPKDTSVTEESEFEYDDDAMNDEGEDEISEGGRGTFRAGSRSYFNAGRQASAHIAKAAAARRAQFKPGVEVINTMTNAVGIVDGPISGYYFPIRVETENGPVFTEWHYDSMKLVNQPVSEETDTEEEKFLAWQEAVKAKHPGKVLKFVGRQEGNTNTVSAEVPGEDRSYGVWYSEDGYGDVFELDESMLCSNNRDIKAFEDWLGEFNPDNFLSPEPQDEDDDDQYTTGYYIIKADGTVIEGPFSIVDSAYDSLEAEDEMVAYGTPTDTGFDACEPPSPVTEAKKPKKFKDEGWYVVDHMDKPVAGPFTEGGAQDEADELNDDHAEKNGTGDITPFDVLYFSADELKAMNESAKEASASLQPSMYEQSISRKAWSELVRKTYGNNVTIMSDGHSWTAVKGKPKFGESGTPLAILHLNEADTVLASGEEPVAEEEEVVVDDLSILQRMKHILKTKHGRCGDDFVGRSFHDIERMFLDAGEPDFR